VSSVRFQEGVARYLDWETLAFWVRSLAEVSQQLPPPARATLDSELPGFWGYVGSTRPNIQSYSTWLWDELLKWVENHLFSEAVTAAGLMVCAPRSGAICVPSEPWTTGLGARPNGPRIRPMNCQTCRRGVQPPMAMSSGSSRRFCTTG
jgi:hypothetical protein